MKELIKRINELVAISKERELTFDEIEERKFLREKYIESFKNNLKSQLDNIVFVGESSPKK